MIYDFDLYDNEISILSLMRLKVSIYIKKNTISKLDVVIILAMIIFYFPKCSLYNKDCSPKERKVQATYFYRRIVFVSIGRIKGFFKNKPMSTTKTY